MAIPPLGFSGAGFGHLLCGCRLPDVVFGVPQSLSLGRGRAKEGFCRHSKLRHIVDAQRGVLDRAQKQCDLADSSFVGADQYWAWIGFGVELAISGKPHFPQHLLFSCRPLLSGSRIDLDLDLSS